MKDQLFIEVIKIENGMFVNPQPHIERIFSTTLHFFAKPLFVELNNDIIPTHLHTVGIVKCRIVYGSSVRETQRPSWLCSVSFHPIGKIAWKV